MRHLVIILAGAAILCLGKVALALGGPDLLLDQLVLSKNLSRTDVAAIARSTNAPWAVVLIAPDQLCGLPIYDPRANGGALPATGTLSVKRMLGSEVPAPRDTYLWKLQPPVSSWLLRYTRETADQTAVRLKTPFENGDETGLPCLCQLRFDTAGSPIVSNVYLIPDGWTGYLDQAVYYMKHHPELVTPNNRSEDELRDLLSYKNPYLSLTAAQLLLARHAFIDRDMEFVLGSHDTKLIAATVACVIVSEQGSPDKPISQILLREQQSIDRLEGIAIGIAAADDLQIPQDVYDMNETAHDAALIGPSLASTRSKPEIEAIRHQLDMLVLPGAPKDETYHAIETICNYYDPAH